MGQIEFVRVNRLGLFLLATLVPIWVVAFGLHLKQVAAGRLAWVGVFVSCPRSDKEYPIVRGFWPGTDAAESSGLEPGDRVLRVGSTDLRGADPIGFVAHALAQADKRLNVAVVFERDGATNETSLALTPARYPWRIAPFIAGVALTGVVVLLRVAHSPIGRIMFLAAMAFASQWTFFLGGPPIQTYAWTIFFVIASTLLFPTVLRMAIVYPQEVDTQSLQLPRWPWLSVVYGVVAFSWVFGTPLPPPFGQQVAMLMNVALIVLLLTFLARNFRRLGPMGRRQVKWGILGMYLGLAPMMIADLVSALRPSSMWIHDAGALSLVAIPAGFLLGILRFNLFDVDRLITSTAVYSILSFFFLTCLFAAVPAVAGVGGSIAGFQSSTLEPWIAALFALSISPMERVLQPRIERTFFPERLSLRNGIDALLQPVDDGDPDAAVIFIARKLESLLKPESCTVYIRTGSSFARVFARLPMGTPPSPASFRAASPLIDEVAAERATLDIQRLQYAARYKERSPEVVAALGTLDATVVLPIHDTIGLSAFITLGMKQSGDVYTRTDLGLLSTVAAHLSRELRDVTPSSDERRAFLSHSALDAKQANRVCELLEARGVACWIAPRNITPGRDFAEQIIRAIEDAFVVILLLSPDANESTYVRREIERACDKQVEIVVFRLQDVEPAIGFANALATANRIDGWIRSLPEQVEALANVLHGLYPKSSPLIPNGVESNERRGEETQSLGRPTE